MNLYSKITVSIKNKTIKFLQKYQQNTTSFKYLETKILKLHFTQQAKARPGFILCQKNDFLLTLRTPYYMVLPKLGINTQKKIPFGV